MIGKLFVHVGLNSVEKDLEKIQIVFLEEVKVREKARDEVKETRGEGWKTICEKTSSMAN